MGSSSNTTETTNTRTPYSPAEPGLDSAARGITNWMNSPTARRTYTGPRVAQMTDTTRAGLDHLADASGARRSVEYLTGVLDQDMSSNNPYFNQMSEAIRAQVMPGLNAQFSNAGMSGSTLHQGSVAQGLTNGMAPVMFNAYENERNRQQAAAGLLPQIDAMIGNQGVFAGQTAEGYTQRNIDARRQAFDERRMAGIAPYLTALPGLSTIGNMGGTTNQNSTTTENPGLTNTLLGVGMAGLGMMTGNPMMMAGGMSGMMGGGYPGMTPGQSVGPGMQPPITPQNMNPMLSVPGYGSYAMGLPWSPNGA